MPSTLCIVGAGSNYTPVLVDSILKHFAVFPFSQVALMDISSERLEIVANYIKFQLERYELATQVDLYDDLRPA